MINTQQLSKHFGNLKALDNISLTCNPAEAIALIGPNGCGKTTLIKCILGMVIPNSGELYVDGKNIKDNVNYRNAIGYMPQIGRYPENMSIGQVIEMIKSIRSSESALDEDLLHEFKLKSLFHKKMSTLSGGTTQKVSATLAFLFNPKILILDEPTAGLDPIASELLKEKIQYENKKGKLVIITSHFLSELDELISHLIFMQDGQVKLHKSISDLRNLTGEQKISKSIVSLLKNPTHV